jgi:hypothetical protein
MGGIHGLIGRLFEDDESAPPVFRIRRLVPGVWWVMRRALDYDIYGRRHWIYIPAGIGYATWEQAADSLCAANGMDRSSC